MNEQIGIDQYTLELLNRGVDGDLRATEREELLKLLANSSEAREFNEELKSFTQLMAEVPEIEPPPYLQESIERQIRLPVGDKAVEQKQGFLGTWLSANWLRTGFALAAGVLLTLAVYEMGSRPISDQDATRIVGTVVKNQASAQGELLDRIQISTETLNGFVELRQMDDLFALDVQLNSDGRTEVAVNFAGRGLDFEGITWMQDRSDAVTVTDGSINVVSSGEQRYTLELRHDAETPGQHRAPLELDFLANDSLIHEAELSVSRQ